MKLQTRLILLGLPLVVLPLAASLGIFALNMASSEKAARFRALKAELSLVQQHVEAAWGVLSRVGFEDSLFYQRAVVQNLGANLTALTGPGETALIVDHTGMALLGPPECQGRTLTTSDPLGAVLKAQEGELVVPGGVAPGGQPSLVVFRRFAPWNWTLATLAPESLVWAQVFGGLGWSILGSLGFLGLAVVGFWFLARGISRPVVELQALAGRMTLGQFDLRARVSGPDEVLALAREWNAMAEKVEALTSGLEQRVSERTRDLAQALDHTKTMQGQLILSEKMASLGQLVAGIAHELNTPLGAIGSAQRALDEVLGTRWPAQMEVLATLDPGHRVRLWAWLEGIAEASVVTDTVARRKLRKSLAAQLRTAGVWSPDEVADRLVEVGLVDWNPEDLALLSGEAGRPLVSALGDLAQVRLASAVVEMAVAKASRVIGALRIYSRHDTGRGTSAVSLARSFDTVLTLVHNRLKAGIVVDLQVPPDLVVVIDADRLDQLWTNLINNALSAMGNRGRLGIEAFQEGPEIVVRVIDSGAGIPLEVQPRIFTPFFTTKKAGEGRGLGLSICQTIVQEAKGTLSFTSVPGRTVFEARFPCP